MLKDYINDEFITIKESVKRKIEITELSIKYKKKPIFLENIEGKKGVINLWADRDRIYRELGMNRSEFLNRYNDALESREELTLGDKKFTRKISMEDIPVCWYYPKDAGFYITSGIFVAEKGNKRNLSIHRVFVRNNEEGLVRLVPRDLYKMYLDSIEHGEELRVSIVIGSPLEYLLAAATSTNYEQDESQIAASLFRISKNKKMLFSKSKNGILVPSDSDFVINAVLTDSREDEGPFKDVTGTYDFQKNQPKIIFESVESVEEPVYHILVPATYEHFNLMGLPREPTIFREIKKDGVDVKDVRLTEGGSSWLHGVVKIKKKSEEDFKKTVDAAFRGHKSMKRVIVVDEDINIYDDQDVEWALATRFQADRGIIIKKEKGSSLDPSSYPDNITSKMGMDATKPIGGGGKFEKE